MAAASRSSAASSSSNFTPMPFSFVMITIAGAESSSPRGSRIDSLRRVPGGEAREVRTNAPPCDRFAT